MNELNTFFLLSYFSKFVAAFIILHGLLSENSLYPNDLSFLRDQNVLQVKREKQEEFRLY